MASFDDTALSKLTEKIDQKLSEKNQGSKKKQGQPAQQSPKTKTKTKQPQQNNQSPQTKPNLKRKRPDDKTEHAAKKRLDQPKHDFKDKNDRKAKHAEKKGPKPSQNSTPSSNALLDEIRALGGDEKDLELVGDIDSEDEAVGGGKGSKLDKALQAELAKFASGLGFEKVQPDEGEDADQIDEEVDGEEGGEEGDGDSETDSKDSPAVEQVKTKEKDKKTAQLVPKGDWKSIFEPRPDWHAAELVNLPEPKSDEVAPYFSSIAGLKAHAKNLLEEDSSTHNTSLASSSSRKFMSEIMASGTMSDKTSALTLAIQESPVHSTKALENLITLATKRSRGQALAAAAALVDLLGPGSLLPSDRRLRPFAAQPGLIGTLQKHKIKSWSDKQGLPGMINKQHLISWAFEDWLKEAYFRIIQAIETWCNDEIEYSRVRSIDMVYALLKDKPEQESNLLRLLVNKLGDREKKIASRASYLLLQLLNIHPGMKTVMIKTVEQEVIFRPGQSIRTKYYAANTLNQTILSSKEPQIADSLLKIYFGMFVALLKSGDLGEVEKFEASDKPERAKAKKRTRAPGPSRKEEEEAKSGQAERESAEKLVSAILTGINRAVPFSDTDSSTLESHLDTLFRITHSSNFNTSIQALMLIQQMATKRHLATERFYRTLYESLLDPRLTTSSKQPLYLNLLYRSLKSDIDVRRVKAFVKRMLQVLNLHQPSFICGIIYLIMELWATFPDLSTLLTEPEEHDEAVEGNAGEIYNDDTSKPKDAYDGRKRVPEYSNAHRSCLWELLPFLRHFHPTVDIYASSLLRGQKPAQKPDLANHTLINFLDKFVYKNPKAADTTRGHSIMQPVTAAGQGSVLVSGKPGSKTAGSVNSAAFWNKKVEDVAADDVFFHEYFSQIGKPGQTDRAKKAKEAAEEQNAQDSDAGEDEIWEALKASRPEVADDSESEVGSDFEDMMGDDSDGVLDDVDGMDLDGESDGSALDFSDASSLDFGSDDEEEEGGAPVDEAGEEKPESASRKRRKMLKGLPTFASVDDYAEMLAQEEEGQ
ncbi:putative CCAAT-binding factor domain-containing protein [Seiridium unicorne]|uniref:CCAAT-binding factor domain-containing protein n=1 Tax=Seiridium unicorne TaxID=138068 RepID=A0ABR2UGF4_9PEZI